MDLSKKPHLVKKHMSDSMSDDDMMCEERFMWTLGYDSDHGREVVNKVLQSDIWVYEGMYLTGVPLWLRPRRLNVDQGQVSAQ
jgi:hypothetical protein